MLKTNLLTAALFGMLAIPATPSTRASTRASTAKRRSRTPGPTGQPGDKLARFATEARIGGRAV